MAQQQYFTTIGVNTYQNPLTLDGGLIHSVNMISYPYGAKTKRQGYSAFLGTPDNSQINSLFTFPFSNGTQMNIYRASGSALYYSLQGTGSWTLAGNGTISNGGHVDSAILNDVMVVGDGIGSTRHSLDGTSFVNTTLAPIAPFFEMYQNRIYAGGTASTLFYSTTNDATNWNLAGTSDSSSLFIPGMGRLSKIFSANDKLVIPKNSGLMYKWDGNSLIDMTTKYGVGSPYSCAQVEGYRFFINNLGLFGYSGSDPTILSNAIQRQFYNPNNTGIAGTTLGTIPADCYIYDYLASVGDVTDDFTQRKISNAIIKYDYQKNEFLNWSFANKPTAFLGYVDPNGNRNLIFGDGNGQCYKLDTSTTDNGAAIPSEMVFLFTFQSPEYQKKWNYYRLIFSPGCEAKVQFAYAENFNYSQLRWFDAQDCTSGVSEGRFTAGADGARSRFLYMRIYDSSKNSRYTYYGASLDAEVLVKT